jgi:uncharacterized protein YbjT (DUF2867 family)
MYAITGITGKVGGELAHNLLAAGQRVRAIVRNASKGEEWAALGCEVALAKMEDGLALADAFTGATATFILPPPEFDPESGYPEARAVIDGVVEALTKARPARVLRLSTIGADAVHDNLHSQRTMMEAALRKLTLPLTILRPAWFIDNASYDVASACETGSDPHLPTATGQSLSDGRREGRWECGGGPHSRERDRRPGRRAGGTMSRNAERPRRRLRHRHRKAGACEAGTPRLVVCAVPLAGYEKPWTPHADARRF